MKKDYQKITEKIAQEGGLQTDHKQYFDPIYNSWMQGNFLRRLFVTHHPWIKILTSIIVFFIPSSLWLFLGIIAPSMNVTGRLFFSFLIIIYTLIGIKIFISGIQDFMKKNSTPK